VHSPFVYDYITKGLGNSGPEIPNNILLYRKALLSNHDQIEITDFGAGSKVFKDNKRVISQLAATAGISGKRGTLLFKTLNYFKPKTILEIGTSLGLATTYMSGYSNGAKVFTLEGCPEIAGVAKKYFREYNFNNIEVIVGEFGLTLPTVLKNKKFDLIYFDGNHLKEPTIGYFEQCLEAAHGKSIFIFDDIHWTNEMEAAWDFIKNHKKVTISIDSFKWGLVFFRKNQVKQHFTLRF
jgi:predicted O-methyltransferase YrrM